MRRRLRRLTVVVMALMMALSVGAASALAQNSGTQAKQVVGPTGSIQKAVNAANPGDTVVVLGTHREDVVIRKNNITLRGVGAKLLPPKKVGSPCGPSGICILGDVNFNTGEVNRYVSNVTVSGFTVRGFGDSGIIALGARNADFKNNRALGNHEYGIAAFSSTGTQIVANTTKGSDEAGIYVGDSPRANASVRANSTSNNFLGVFVRNARHGDIRGNRISGNCMGVLFLADAPGPSGLFNVRGNAILDNSKACAAAPEEGVPPISGIGIGLLGSNGVEISGNSFRGNVPSGPSLTSGGVAIIRGIGGTPPRNNAVFANSFGKNDPDIFWDGSGSGNKLKPNRCNSSVPAGICG